MILFFFVIFCCSFLISALIDSCALLTSNLIISLSEHINHPQHYVTTSHSQDYYYYCCCCCYCFSRDYYIIKLKFYSWFQSFNMVTFCMSFSFMKNSTCVMWIFVVRNPERLWGIWLAFVFLPCPISPSDRSVTVWSFNENQ